MLMEAIGLALAGVQEIAKTSNIKEQGRLQSDFFAEGIQGLDEASSTLQESLGASLSLPALEAKRLAERSSDLATFNLENVRKKQENITASTGFAGIGMDDEMIKRTRKAAQDKLEDIDIGLSKTMSDTLSNFEQQRLEFDLQRKQLEGQKRLADQQADTKYFGLF